MTTVVVFGDQLNQRIGALADAVPGSDRVLLVESDQLLTAGRHVQRNHLVITAMRRFADELRDAGHDVDLRRAATMAAGIHAHVDEFDPDRLVATAATRHPVAARHQSHGATLVVGEPIPHEHLGRGRLPGDRTRRPPGECVGRRGVGDEREVAAVL